MSIARQSNRLESRHGTRCASQKHGSGGAIQPSRYQSRQGDHSNRTRLIHVVAHDLWCLARQTDGGSGNNWSCVVSLGGHVQIGDKLPMQVAFECGVYDVPDLCNLSLSLGDVDLSGLASETASGEWRLDWIRFQQGQLKQTTHA